MDAPGSFEPALAEKPKAVISESNAPALANASRLRKNVLLAAFCMGLFLDALNNSAMLPAIPAVSHNVGLADSDSVWLFAAYQATFASFLLISGRISDIYSPKPVFTLGTAFFGLMCLGGGFVKDRIPLLALRALQGIGASLTIPSSLSLIVQMFPEPQEQSRAIGLLGAVGAIGNVSVILFVYALTSGSVVGWREAGVLVPLLVSISLAIAFFVWEARISEDTAALPPKLWYYKNFAVLFAVALMPYFWWIQVYLTFSTYWQEHLGWSSIISGVKLQVDPTTSINTTSETYFNFSLPLGVVEGLVMAYGGQITRIGHPKRMILAGLVAALVATVLLPFSDRLEDQYWPLTFPAFIIGTAGTSVVYIVTNINIFRTTPSRYAGTVGAVFNAALQLGSAIGATASTSIQASVDNRAGEGGAGFQGRSMALWFLVVWVGLEIIGVALFFQSSTKAPPDEDTTSSAVGVT